MDKSLLSIFEQKIQTNIIEFCKNLNKTEADLYIVMARKAACLVSVLEKLSLLSLRGEVISERVIDCRIEWKALQKVIIIDDVVISGTTLYSTIEFIKEKNPNVEIQLYVLGVNDKWYNDDVLENDGVSYIQTPIRRLNNSECIKLSGDIVRLLSMYPVPYNIDFPIYNTLKLSEEDLHSVLSIPGWYVSKVTAFSQKANEVFTHTFIPNNYILDSCTPSLSCDFLSKSLLKIRTYGRSRLDKQKIFYHITIVPMLIMPPISEDELNKLFFMIVGNNNDDIVSYLNTPTSKLRLVQFILADVLARRFLQEINYILGNSTAVSREFSSLRYLFPPILIKGIVKLAETFSTPLPSVHLAKVQTHIKPARKIDSLWDVNYNLFKPFIDFYYNDEIPSRQLVKEKGKKVFGNREYQKIIDRLKRGYSLTNLLDMLPNIKNDKKILLLSSFLDNYIDEGVVVPITVHEKNLIFRAFRHGEDVQFSQQEERLCYDMLNAFYDELSKKREDNDKSNRNDMQKLWVEKMLVLLLQLGEGRVFESLQTDISQYSHIKRVEKTDIASVRYYLQGPVIVKTPERNIIGQPYLEYTDKANWLTSIFKQDDKSPLVESPNGMYSFNKDAYVKLSQDESCQIVVDAKKTSFANKVGRIFGYLLRNHARGIKPSLSGDELVTLTSSLESKNVMGAMAAEINIFKNGFRDSSENSISNILSLMCDHSLDIDQGFSMIRKKTSYQALNDGCRKYLWYNNSVGYDIIKEISLNFEDEVYRIEWDDFWSPNLEKYGNDESPIIKELVQKEGYWLLCVTVYLYLLEYLLQKERDNNYQNAELIKQIKDIYDKIKSVGHHKLVSEIMPIILEFNAKHHQDSYVKKSIPIIHGRLNALLNRSDEILGSCKEYFSNFLKVPMIQYFNHALYVEIESEKGRSLLNYLYEIIIFKMNKSTEEIKTQIRFIDTNSSPLIATHHCWFISYNEEGAKWLLQLAIEAMSILRGRVGLKMFFFPHLPPETHVKLIDNTYISSEAFWPFILHFLADINSASYCNGNIYVATETNNNELLEDINKRFLNFTPSFIEEKVVYSPNRRDYKLIKFTDKMNYNMENSFDVGILTIVDEEARAIINGFGMDMNNPKIIDNHYYDEGEYEFDGKKIRLVHHQCTKQGNVQMAVAFMEMLKHYNPTYMVLLGIAGSIKQNINICDVVIASDILYYEPRKESGHEVIEHRLEHFNMSPAMNNRITRYRMVTSSPLSASADSFNSDFSLHVSPIGTGEAVIADSLSKTKEWLLTVNSKTGIVETEAAGFSSAFNFSTSDVRDILIIRGISDKADVTKDDKWRQPACDNAVIVLKDFMKKILFV